MTRTGCTPRRKPAFSAAGVAGSVGAVGVAGVVAALVAALLALAASTPPAAGQEAGAEAGAEAGPYPDTPPGAFYTQAIEALDQDGVFAGTLCDEGFCPDDPLDRATMAVWTVRVLDQQDPPAVTSTRFADVDATHPYAAFIERFAQTGVTRGCGDGTNYCPDDTVTRSFMAVFLARAFALAPAPDPGFSDVAADAWYAPEVAKLAASGITRGCGDGTRFCPDQTTTRAHMATFLARAIDLVGRPGASTTEDGDGSTAEDADESTTEGESTSSSESTTEGADGSTTEGADESTTSGESTSEAESTNEGAGDFTSISAGNKHACAVRTDKSLECWGDNLERQLNAPAGEFLAVSAGGFHTCALRVDNTLSCWGDRSDGQTMRPRAEFLSVSSGFRHTCAVSAGEGSEGNVQCWGFDINGQATPTAGSYLKVSAGWEHTCGLRTDGAVQCWGGNGHGQAGVEDPTGPMTCSVSGCRRGYARIWGPFIDVSAGTTHTCAVRAGGSLECWGETRELQAIPPAGEFVAVSAGFRHSCALAVDNTVSCWGRDAFGETQAPAGEFLSVSAGSSFSCGVRPGNSIECWGYSADGRATPPTA